MKYIKKTSIPEFFIEDTKRLVDWDDYRKKRDLKQHILDEEQNQLCIYCESKVNLDTSHVEHIKPKSLDKANLTFDYNNLSVSCNGSCHNEAVDNAHYTCGHRKDRDDTEYDETKFLNPTKITDVRGYFEYDLDDFKINPSNKDEIKAKYMIDILKLNDGSLPKARKIALKNFNNKIIKFKIDDKVEKREKIKEILNKENTAFISFLRYKYNKFL